MLSVIFFMVGFVIPSLFIFVIWKWMSKLETSISELWHTVDTIGRKCQKLVDDDCRKVEKLKDEIRLLRHEIYDIRENVKKQSHK